MESYLISKDANGILFYTINRPEKRNAVNDEIMDGLEVAISMAKAEEIKALVITGAGDRAFCSGGDLSVFHLLKTKEDAYPMLSKMAKIISELLLLPKPTVALMNGVAIGGGCEIATACDFRLGRKEMKAGFVQGNLAITTGWGGGSILCEKFPASTALKMLTDGTMLSADELLNIGFLDHIFEGDPYTNCTAFLGKLIEKEVGVLSAYVAILRRKWSDASILERIEQEAINCATLWGKEIHHQKVEEFLRK
ncbi:enoyl-CoA hydratase/isomerase family protein [Mesobacillus maritimus]|uniref:enoyl-CoA hydratase/isomerase family protein n=1 Tax=Mesobacillus maritimus TaxID=1643336 RepID=UPI00384F3816